MPGTLQAGPPPLDQGIVLFCGGAADAARSGCACAVLSMIVFPACCPLQAFTGTTSGQAVLWGSGGELLPSALPTTATPRSTLPFAAAERQALQLVRLHDSGAVSSLAAAGGLLVTGGADGAVRVFDGRLRIVAWCEVGSSRVGGWVGDGQACQARRAPGTRCYCMLKYADAPSSQPLPLLPSQQDPLLASGVAAISAGPAPSSSVGGPAEAAPPDLLVTTASGKVVALPSAAFQLAVPLLSMDAGPSARSSMAAASR